MRTVISVSALVGIVLFGACVSQRGALTVGKIERHVRAPSPRSEAVWKQFKAEHPKSEIVWNKQTGTARTLRSFSVRTKGPTARKRAESFLKEHSALFGMDAELRSVEHVSTRESFVKDKRTIDYVRFRQMHEGIPVFGAEAVIQMTPSGKVFQVRNQNYVDVVVGNRHRISRDQALAIAREKAGQSDFETSPFPEAATLVIYPNEPGFFYAWKADVHKWTFIIDADTGELLRKYDAVVYQNDGVAIVYEKNSCDSTAAPQAIHHLDDSGYLKGDFFEVTTMRGTNVHSGSHEYLNPPSRGNKFAQAEVYYQLERARSFFLNLGFLDQSLPGQVVHALVNDPYNECKAYYNFAQDYLDFGTPGDPCFRPGEDGDIIFHEYSHKIVTMAVGGDVYDPGQLFSALNEAVADYFAASFFDDSCLAEPHNKNCGQCMRNVDNTKKVVYDKDSNPHIMGLILSGAMWDVRELLTEDLADQVFLNGLYGLHKHSDFSDYAQNVLAETVAYFGDIDSFLEVFMLAVSIEGVRDSFCQHGIRVSQAYGGCVRIQWWEEKDFRGAEHTRVLFKDENGQCVRLVNNDAMKSVKFWGNPGQKVELYDSPSCSTSDDWAVITFPQDDGSNLEVVEVPKIGWRGENEANPPGTYVLHRDNGLLGNVSAIRFRR